MIGAERILLKIARKIEKVLKKNESPCDIWKDGIHKLLVLWPINNFWG